MPIHAVSGKIYLSLLTCLCSIPVNLLYGADARPVKAAELIPTYSLLLSDPIARQKIFIIGASTVLYDNILPGDINATTGHSQYPTRIGWGSALYRYMLFSGNVFNQARRGATSLTYREQPPPPDDPDYKGPGWWGGTRDLIQSMDNSRGGFLFIQFGANDMFQNVSETAFKAGLRFYRGQAFALGLTPVFITPVDSRAAGDNRGAYPGYMIDVALEPRPARFQDRKVLLLDLHQKSLEIFTDQSTTNLDYRFGNVPYINHDSGDFSRTDHTHFKERGAVRVAGWVRDLACELTDQSLCRLFTPTRPAAPATIYFTGEYIDDPNDPEINGWYVTDPDGSIRANEMHEELIIDKDTDPQTGSQVMIFNTYYDAGNNDNNRLLMHGFQNQNNTKSWANRDQHAMAWAWTPRTEPGKHFTATWTVTCISLNQAMKSSGSTASASGEQAG